MKYYFQIQLKMISRHFAGFGIHPAVAYPILIAAFIGFSIFLFAKTDFASYIYILIGLSSLVSLSEIKRNQFLKSCFSKQQYYQIRMIENILVVLPFAVFLVYKMMFIQAVILIISAAILSMIAAGNKSGFPLPTPFGLKPFEFTVGFRSTFLMIFLAYFLVIMAISADNFNLGIASLILVFLVCYAFYFNPENEFYVWIYHFSPGKFIIKKINTAFLYSTYLSMPVAIVLIAFFPGNSLIIAGFMVLGYIYLATVILAKYSAFPNQISLPQFFILGLSAWFPPLLIAVIPFFYKQSVKRLKEIL